MTSVPFTQPARECGDCNMCCQGFLPANIHGYHMMQGLPCHFVSDNPCGGCTIYEDRPDVCQGYQCLWKMSPSIPEWMKPNKADCIISGKEATYEGIEYKFLQVKEGHKPIRGEVLNYILRMCIYNNFNVQYEVLGNWYWHGDEHWMKHSMNSMNVTEQEPAQDA